MDYKDGKGLGNKVLSPEKADDLARKMIEDKKSEEDKPVPVIKEWKDLSSSEKIKFKDDKEKKQKEIKKRKAKAKKKAIAMKKEKKTATEKTIKKEKVINKKNKNMEQPKVEEKKDRVAEATKERQKMINETSEDEGVNEPVEKAEKSDGLPTQAEAAEQREEELLSGEKREKKEGTEKPESKKEEAEAAEKEKTKENVLEAARGEFVRAGKNYEKYRGLTGDISKIFKKGERVAVIEEYKKAKQEYESVRAEHVGEHMNKFVDEMTKLADEQAEKFEKSKWKKVWDWAGKQNLEKLGWKPEGKIGKFLAKGLNLRTAVSLGLLGTGIGFGMGSAVGLSALIAKRIYGVAATATGSYELLRMGTERYSRLTEKKLVSLDLDKAEELMAKYQMRAKLKGEEVSENEDYQKLKERYLEIAGGTDKKVEELMKSADETLGKMSEKLKRGDLYRKIVAVGAGTVIGTIGLNKIMEQVYGGPVEEMKELVGKTTEAPVGTNTKPALEISSEAQAKAEFWKGTPEIPETEAAAETIEMPDKFVGVVQANEGYIHEARKALVMYIHEFGDEKLQNLTPAQKIWAEDRLWDLYREAHPEAEKTILKVGDKVGFSAENIKQVLGEVQDKFGAPEKSAQLSENLKHYIDNVKWDRYGMVKVPQGEVYGWEIDEGIKAVDWKEEISGAAAVAEKSEIGKELLSERLEEAKQLFDGATYREVYSQFNLSADEYKIIKDVPVGEFVDKFSYWNAPKDMISGEVDHLELWRKLKIKDMIIESGASTEELKMPLHEYLKQHWFGTVLEDISETKDAMPGIDTEAVAPVESVDVEEISPAETAPEEAAVKPAEPAVEEKASMEKETVNELLTDKDNEIMGIIETNSPQATIDQLKTGEMNSDEFAELYLHNSGATKEVSSEFYQEIKTNIENLSSDNSEVRLGANKFLTPKIQQILGK